MTQRNTPSDPVRLEVEILNDTIDAENDGMAADEPQKEQDQAPPAIPEDLITPPVLQSCRRNLCIP